MIWVSKWLRGNTLTWRTRASLSIFWVVAAVTVACAARNGGLVVGSKDVSAAGEPVAAIWASGVALPAGQRWAVSDGETGWVVTQVFQNNSLLLTRFSLADGTFTTIVLEKDLGRFSGAGLSADGAGHLWIAYSDAAVRVDETTGAIDRWPLTEISGGELGSDNPSAGNAQAAAWDAKDHSLLFVRNFDHWLYRLNPSDGVVSRVVDMELIASTVSSLAVSDDGTLGVTGSASSAVYTPVAARIVSGKPEVVPNSIALCAISSQLVVLGQDGGIRTLGDEARLVANVSAPQARSPLACYGGNIFQAGAGDGQITIDRISIDGDVVELGMPLAAAGTVTSFGGKDVPGAWLDPGLQSLVPDQTGGVWVVVMSGTQEGEGDGPSYPSLVHLSISP